MQKHDKACCYKIILDIKKKFVNLRSCILKNVYSHIFEDKNQKTNFANIQTQKFNVEKFQTRNFEILYNLKLKSNFSILSPYSPFIM